MASSAIGSKRNVKIFVLYLMENINYPLDYATLNDIIMQTDYVMYLDFAESFHEMIDAGLIVEVEGEEKNIPMYLVSEKGKIVARELNSDILALKFDFKHSRLIVLGEIYFEYIAFEFYVKGA